nr:hypothetical protein CFP56_17005 [Quercus suber]
MHVCADQRADADARLSQDKHMKRRLGPTGPVVWSPTHEKACGELISHAFVRRTLLAPGVVGHGCEVPRWGGFGRRRSVSQPHALWHAGSNGRGLHIISALPLAPRVSAETIDFPIPLLICIRGHPAQS